MMTKQWKFKIFLLFTKKVLLEMRPPALKVLFDILWLGSSINYILFCICIKQIRWFCSLPSGEKRLNYISLKQNEMNIWNIFEGNIQYLHIYLPIKVMFLIRRGLGCNISTRFWIILHSYILRETLIYKFPSL